MPPIRGSADPETKAKQRQETLARYRDSYGPQYVILSLSNSSGLLGIANVSGTLLACVWHGIGMPFGRLIKSGEIYNGLSAFNSRELLRYMTKTQSASEGRPIPRRPAPAVVTNKAKRRILELQSVSDETDVGGSKPKKKARVLPGRPAPKVSAASAMPTLLPAPSTTGPIPAMSAAAPIPVVSPLPAHLDPAVMLPASTAPPSSVPAASVPIDGSPVPSSQVPPDQARASSPESDVIDISDVSTPPPSPRVRKTRAITLARPPGVPTAADRLPPLPPRLRAEQAAARMEAAATQAEDAARRISEDAAKMAEMGDAAEAAVRRIGDHAERAFGMVQHAGEIARLIGQEADRILAIMSEAETRAQEARQRADALILANLLTTLSVDPAEFAV
ncbi:hypothetical protein B0H15DRAFT_798936 [Mycena belliarum]|uniref:Uncharacterized protein n=1 Tax=Mycena belliarum TaxID=1033014 RepID=A0AAD6XPJ3_9AGAR|nr:hypothetical protein B0H15DRAFT_798936 [Mycena belliae]